MLFHKQQGLLLFLHTKSLVFPAFKPVMVTRKLMEKKTKFKQRSNQQKVNPEY